MFEERASVRLAEALRKLIWYYCTEYDMLYSEIIGALAAEQAQVERDMILQSEREEEEEEEEEDNEDWKRSCR
jgi:hypothetical protein